MEKDIKKIIKESVSALYDLAANQTQRAVYADKETDYASLRNNKELFIKAAFLIVKELNSEMYGSILNATNVGTQASETHDKIHDLGKEEVFRQTKAATKGFVDKVEETSKEVNNIMSRMESFDHLIGKDVKLEAGVEAEIQARVKKLVEPVVNILSEKLNHEMRLAAYGDKMSIPEISALAVKQGKMMTLAVQEVIVGALDKSLHDVQISALESINLRNEKDKLPKVDKVTESIVSAFGGVETAIVAYLTDLGKAMQQLKQQEVAIKQAEQTQAKGTSIAADLNHFTERFGGNLENSKAEVASGNNQGNDKVKGR